jgi:hypothetical protein
MAPQQHAIWIAQARAHLKEHRPRAFAQMTEAGTLERHLQTLAQDASEQMRRLIGQGATWDEAQEQVRETLLPAPEADSEPAMPETEGFKAHRELIHGLNNLRMPGEKDEDEE